LTWSHATVVSLVHEYVSKRASLTGAAAAPLARVRA